MTPTQPEGYLPHWFRLIHGDPTRGLEGGREGEHSSRTVVGQRAKRIEGDEERNDDQKKCSTGTLITTVLRSNIGRGEAGNERHYSC